MTEAEALTKWCPRKIGHDISYGNQDHLCGASACMAWRVLTRTEMRHRDGHVVRAGEIYLRGNATPHDVPDGGFCGLAGAPS